MIEKNWNLLKFIKKKLEDNNLKFEMILSILKYFILKVQINKDFIRKKLTKASEDFIFIDKEFPAKAFQNFF